MSHKQYYSLKEINVLKQSKGLEENYVMAVLPTNYLVVATLSRNRNQFYLDVANVIFRHPDSPSRRASAEELFDEYVDQMKRLTA